jgi:hypothetical protein
VLRKLFIRPNKQINHQAAPDQMAIPLNKLPYTHSLASGSDEVSMEESDGNKNPTTSPTATARSKEMPTNGNDVLA